MQTIRELREARGLSQFKLAIQVGVTPASIHQWESGKNAPGAARLRALAAALGVKMDDIIIVRKPQDGNGRAR